MMRREKCYKCHKGWKEELDGYQYDSDLGRDIPYFKKVGLHECVVCNTLFCEKHGGHPDPKYIRSHYSSSVYLNEKWYCQDHLALGTQEARKLAQEIDQQDAENLVQAELRRKEIEKEKEIEEARRQWTQKVEARQRLEYEKMLREHQAKYKCNTCGKPSSGPYRPHFKEIQFDYPIDLKKCSLCGNYYCKDHIHLGYCYNCAQKL